MLWRYHWVLESKLGAYTVECTPTALHFLPNSPLLKLKTLFLPPPSNWGSESSQSLWVPGPLVTALSTDLPLSSAKWLPLIWYFKAEGSSEGSLEASGSESDCQRFVCISNFLEIESSGPPNPSLKTERHGFLLCEPELTYELRNNLYAQQGKILRDYVRDYARCQR